MNLTLQTCAALVVMNFSAVAVFAGGEGWASDFAAAKKEAAESKKDLLMDFTGSDWCSWCIKLNDEVFKKDEFKAGVKDKFVLVEVDFPKDEKKLSDETKAQNKALGEKYGIQGYPTIVLADAEGKPFATTGYQPGGPVKYLENLDKLRAKKDARDAAMKSAASATGVEKAKALVAALNEMGLEDATVSSFYGDVVEQIKAADPTDETGFGKSAEAKARVTKFQQDLNGLAQKGDFEGALTLVNDTLKTGGFDKEETQNLTMVRAMIFAQLKRYDEAIKGVDEAKAVDPDSEMAASLDGVKVRIEAEKKKGENSAE